MTGAKDASAHLDDVTPHSNLSEVLFALCELGPTRGIERFASSLDPEWIEHALEATGTASIRRRKIPADQVVWLVLGMCLFADRSVTAVVDHLKLTLLGVKSLARSAVSDARVRLGSEPMRWLFEKVSRHWATTPGLGGYAGMDLFGIDGTHLRGWDSDANFEHSANRTVEEARTIRAIRNCDSWLP